MKKHELALGLIYYTDVVQNPKKIIEDIELLDKKLIDLKEPHSFARPWQKWEDGHQFFCWQKFLPQIKELDPEDEFYEEQHSISSRLFEPLDTALNEYYKEYPYAKRTVKNRDTSMHILKYEAGHYLPAHSDQGISSRMLSAIFYLNDDYEGGNIIFPHCNVSLKPEAGSIIFFPSNYIYVHEIETITSGVKYSLPNWYHNREDFFESDGSE